MSLQHIPSQRASGLVHGSSQCSAVTERPNQEHPCEFGIGRDMLHNRLPMERLNEPITEHALLIRSACRLRTLTSSCFQRAVAPSLSCVVAHPASFYSLPGSSTECTPLRRLLHPTSGQLQNSLREVRTNIFQETHGAHITLQDPLEHKQQARLGSSLPDADEFAP
jgi:hypothetical protein